MGELGGAQKAAAASLTATTTRRTTTTTDDDEDACHGVQLEICLHAMSITPIIAIVSYDSNAQEQLLAPGLLTPPLPALPPHTASAARGLRLTSFLTPSSSLAPPRHRPCWKRHGCFCGAVAPWRKTKNKSKERSSVDAGAHIRPGPAKRKGTSMRLGVDGGGGAHIRPSRPATTSATTASTCTQSSSSISMRVRNIATRLTMIFMRCSNECSKCSVDACSMR